MTLSEQQILPFAATELRGERLLVLAPHPDDEVIGCGGLIALHAREKRQVRVLIATDGSAASGPEQAAEDYPSRRERESMAGLQELGAPAPQFLRLPDRQLENFGEKLRERLRVELKDFSPDLVAVPSPIEVHPDHIALTRALIDLIQSDEDLVGDLAVTQVAFYEVSQPIQPNVLLDITDCAEAKYRAISRHASQAELRDYEWFARGLNQYRSMTLFPASKYAEGYHVIEMAKLRTEPWSRLAEEIGGRSPIEVVSEQVPISVVIRTRNRHQWLRDAINSVKATDYPASIIVVNDAGATPGDLDERVRVLDQTKPVGRSEAMNLGVRAAQTPFIAFLDDDDLYYREHLATLATAAGSSSQVAYYTDAVSTFYEPAEDGSFKQTARLRLFAQDFDRELLLFDNYIPLPTLLVSRDDFLGAGGFDRGFDLLEDWDFLIRLSKRGSFLRIPRVTCEIRHFRGGDSAILSSPEESSRFREAKLKIWSRYGELMTPDLIANVFERQKRKLGALFGESVEKKGLAKHLERDVMRLEREKTLLLEELQKKQGLMEQTHEALSQATQHAHRLAGEISVKDHIITEKGELIGKLYAEIKRLNELLDLIYRSKTWKLHQLIERIRRRGA